MVKQEINAWMTAAGVEDGKLLRAVSKGGKVKESMSGWAVWSVVEQSARGIGIERFGAHDLRRTWRNSAGRTAAAWNRSSSSWDTAPSKPPNAI
jgi:integrase